MVFANAVEIMVYAEWSETVSNFRLIQITVPSVDVGALCLQICCDFQTLIQTRKTRVSFSGCNVVVYGLRNVAD